MGRPVEIVSIERVGRGNSRETWFVGYQDGGALRTLTFRLDHVSGPIVPGPLEQEYFVYERLGRTKVPVARALWWEDGAPWHSRPFYVREQVDGSWNVPHILDTAPEWDAHRIAISREHVSKLALVHDVDWQGLGFERWLRAPGGVKDCARNTIDLVMQQYENARVEPVPIMLECAAWLEENAPIAQKVALCKGTNGLGEEIFKEGKIVAMSDWEEAMIGDPAADFAFVQSLIPEISRDGEKLWGMTQALDYYFELTGTRIDPAAVGFYGVIRAMKYGIFALESASSIVAMPGHSQIRQAWTATEVGNISKRLVGAAMGWNSPPAPSFFAEIMESVEQSA